MILGVHHAAVAVPSMDAGLDFYVGVLEFEVCSGATLPGGFAPLAEALGLDDSACRVSMLRKGNSFIELFEFEDQLEAEPKRPVNRLGISHFALSSDEIEADYARLEKAGVVFNAKLFGAAPTRFAYGRDPFDNVIELLEHDADGTAGRRFD